MHFTDFGVSESPVSSILKIWQGLPSKSFSSIVFSSKSKYLLTASGSVLHSRAFESGAGVLKVRLGLRRQKDSHQPLVITVVMPLLSTIFWTKPITSLRVFGNPIEDDLNRNRTNSSSSSVERYFGGPLTAPGLMRPLVRSPKVDLAHQIAGMPA